MKRVLQFCLFLVLLSIAGSASAACSSTSYSNGWTCNNAAFNDAFAGTVNVGYTSPANSLVVIHCVINSVTDTITLTDNNFTFTAIETNYRNTSQNTTTSIAYVYNSGVQHIPTATCASSGGGDTVVVMVSAWTGSATSLLVDAHNITNGAGASSPTITTTNANDLILVYGGDDTGPTWSAGSGFALVDGGSWAGQQAQSVMSTGMYSGSFGGVGTDNLTIGIVAFKATFPAMALAGPAKLAGPATIGNLGGLLLVSDNFTRANSGTLGANWSDALGNTLPWSIISNQAGTPGGPVQEYWSANAFTNNQFSKATFTTMIASANEEVGVRMSAVAGTTYLCGYRQSVDAVNYVVRKLVAGTQTVLSDTSTVVTLNDVVEIDAVGTTITCKVNGSSIFSGTDSSIASGSAGIIANSTGSTALMSNWSGGNL